MKVKIEYEDFDLDEGFGGSDETFEKFRQKKRSPKKAKRGRKAPSDDEDGWN